MLDRRESRLVGLISLDMLIGMFFAVSGAFLARKLSLMLNSFSYILVSEDILLMISKLIFGTIESIVLLDVYSEPDAFFNLPLCTILLLSST
jgi:hypothetical protein